ncbi:hypothetical protein EK21DRAFT_119754 [Setomelanomma holmii]|uniref:Terpenoid synthase n=1 Tax=Setomelanomma holmii TaxID=210430 RepID=A0A9P4LFN6_9PLEO|nr:hypothetical protein EK21DRAFT_119754 [Setomelanomma holmii]
MAAAQSHTHNSTPIEDGAKENVFPVIVSKQAPHDHRDELIALLHGTTVVVPDLEYIYRDWVVRTHPQVDAARERLETWFETYVPTPAECAKQRKVDSALCSASFWTHGPEERFLVLSSVVAWVFFWDDEIDCGMLTNNAAKTDAYCDDTLAFIKHHLQPELDVAAPAAGRLHNSGMWEDIGKAVQKGQTKGGCFSHYPPLASGFR